MTKDDILELAKEAGPLISTPFDVWCERFAALVADTKRKAILAAFQKLRDESQTIVGASDDYKQGRAMGIQLCINELTRVRDD